MPKHASFSLEEIKCQLVIELVILLNVKFSQVIYFFRINDGVASYKLSKIF